MECLGLRYIYSVYEVPKIHTTRKIIELGVVEKIADGYGGREYCLIWKNSYKQRLI